MSPRLGLATQEECARAEGDGGGSGIFYTYGEATDAAVRSDPLARSELGKPHGFDAIHLSETPIHSGIVRWLGRRGDGRYYQIGRWMRMIQPAPIPTPRSATLLNVETKEPT